MSTKTLWISSLNWMTMDLTLKLNDPLTPHYTPPPGFHPALEITTTTPGDQKWVYIGLPLPPCSEIRALRICYQLSSTRSFITQICLRDMKTPDHDSVCHEDPTDLKKKEGCYVSDVGAYRLEGAVTLALRLSFNNRSDKIILGSLGVDLTSDVVNVRCLGAIGDGKSHPLSERFSSLEDAQYVYPNAESLDDEIDVLAIQIADTYGSSVIPGGTFLINDIVLTNPPIFQGKVTLLVKNGASMGLTFQGDLWGGQEVQGGFFIDGEKNETPCVLLTIQGRNWVIPKVRIRGYGKGEGDIGLRFTNYADADVGCSHNHIGFLAINGVTDAVKWDCDDWAVVERGYASNNVIEHAWLLSSTIIWHYNYTVTELPDKKGETQYFKNRLHHGYFEKSDVAFKFTSNKMKRNVIGVMQDWWAVNFDGIKTEIDTDYLRPSGTLHSLGYGTLTKAENNGGDIRNIVQFQKQGPNQYAKFAGTIAEDPGNEIDRLGHQVRISSLEGEWQRGFYFTGVSYGSESSVSKSPVVKKMALGANGTGNNWRYAWLGQTRDNWAVRIDLSNSNLDLQIGDSGKKLAFFGSTPTTKPMVTGSTGGNEALANLLTALENLGLITYKSNP